MNTTTHGHAKLILASRSPRRAQLLREHGFAFEQADPFFDDPPQPEPSTRPGHIAEQLARQKALSLRSHVGADALILAADTICVAGSGQLLGQPASRDQARRMIRGFTDAGHQVVTAVALLGVLDPAPTSFVNSAVVFVGSLSAQQIDSYLDSEQWRGKAGGYNLLERQEAGWPITVQGDPTTVVGLPMAALTQALGRWGIQPEPRQSRGRGNR